jgi:hypothetical protein
MSADELDLSVRRQTNGGRPGPRSHGPRLEPSGEYKQHGHAVRTGLVATPGWHRRWHRMECQTLSLEPAVDIEHSVDRAHRVEEVEVTHMRA